MNQRQRAPTWPLGASTYGQPRQPSNYTQCNTRWAIRLHIQPIKNQSNEPITRRWPTCKTPKGLPKGCSQTGSPYRKGQHLSTKAGPTKAPHQGGPTEHMARLGTRPWVSSSHNPHALQLKRPPPSLVLSHHTCSGQPSLHRLRHGHVHLNVHLRITTGMH